MYMQFGLLSEKLLVAHREMRSLVKVMLRQYEIIAVLEDPLSTYKPVSVADQDNVLLPEFSVPLLKSFFDDEKEETRTELAQIAEDAYKDPKGIAREVYASRAFIKWMTRAYRSVIEEKVKDETAATCGQALFKKSSEILWDSLTLAGQTDLAITDAREAKLAECLTQNFNNTVKNAGNKKEMICFPAKKWIINLIYLFRETF